ncbi:MAG TPA: hypothetical protein VHE61_17755 [Opitutaceae bacterium]|nr:hypothetical protein [Opitutaceae bacterium]
MNLGRASRLLFFAVAGTLGLDGAPPAAVQNVPLDAARPYFVPTHPRVMTTIRFPREIGAPEGAVSIFTEDATAAPGEYLVSWQPGDPYFTVAPLTSAGMANLNVPYQGRTYVLYFYPVTDPLGAVAVVNLLETGPVSAAPVPGDDTRPTGAARQAPTAGQVVKRSTPLPDPSVPATPARLVGFLDRLKLIHATPPGPALAAMAKAMDVQIAIAQDPDDATPTAAANDDPVRRVRARPNDGGLFKILLLRTVRDRRLNCLGFVCLVLNTSDQVLAFDIGSFGARAGAAYLVQRISDAEPILKPGAQSPAYFVVQAPPNAPLLADNDWKLSVDLVSPRLNPGAMIARGFARSAPRP